MNTSGDAAEQIVRLSLEGTEVAFKLTGSAAKYIAAMIYAVLKDQKRTKGKARIESMIRTERPMTAYTLKREDCAEFQKRAKEYGIMFCPIPYKKTDETVDVLVFESDASRVNRIVERFKFSVVDTASIKRDIEKTKTEKTAPAAPEQGKPDKAADDRLLDDLLGAPIRKEENSPPNPEAAKTEKSRPSEPISKKQSKTAEGTAKSPEERPSVREELREIRENRQKEAAEPGVPEPAPAKAPKKQQTTTHKQPSRKRTKKSKER